ncbi:MAG: hypothetical protein K5878_01535 [Rhizobiaceae bacterium]|nr:hypothetical protein [Rhizobiaceae bacterium]
MSIISALIKFRRPLITAYCQSGGRCSLPDTEIDRNTAEPAAQMPA